MLNFMIKLTHMHMTGNKEYNRLRRSIHKITNMNNQYISMNN